ncbi:hypothetical protein M758_UG169400 [Ceratodon purpureus]|nr:hypothetical protein M758_UG169400 [Ceratodon purpureus]
MQFKQLASHLCILGKMLFQNLAISPFEEMKRPWGHRCSVHVLSLHLSLARTSNPPLPALTLEDRDLYEESQTAIVFNDITRGAPRPAVLYRVKPRHSRVTRN